MTRRSERTPFPPFPWKTLGRRLREDERAGVTLAVRGLLRFQRTLDRFPRVRSAPSGTPFVSLYAGGNLRGCYGSTEGDGAERLSRAFLRAVEDDRFGGVSAADRGALVAQVSYPRAARLMNPNSAEEEIEPGTHGVALVMDSGRATLLLPHVARDERIGARDLLHGLGRKAGLDKEAYREGALYVFETEDVVVRGASPDETSSDRGDRETLAAAFLASLIAPDGSVAFAIDPRLGRRVETGPMHHGRAAAVVQALAAFGGREALVERARRRLGSDIRAALGGARVAEWPSDPAAVAGTIALAVLAGVPVAHELTAFVSGPLGRELARVPWHAAQVAAALGAGAPAELWAACVADLDRRPWAPWTLFAADARGDRAVRGRAARALADAIRKAAPHRGGAACTPIPEIALTAVSLEALARHPAPWARAAIARGLDFLASVQLVGRRIYAALDPSLARGAFPASPVVDLLRGDVTGHALLALVAARRASPSKKSAAAP